MQIFFAISTDDKIHEIRTSEKEKFKSLKFCIMFSGVLKVSRSFIAYANFLAWFNHKESSH